MTAFASKPPIDIWDVVDEVAPQSRPASIWGVVDEITGGVPAITPTATPGKGGIPVESLPEGFVLPEYHPQLRSDRAPSAPQQAPSEVDSLDRMGQLLARFGQQTANVAALEPLEQMRPSTTIAKGIDVMTGSRTSGVFEEAEKAKQIEGPAGVLNQIGALAKLPFALTMDYYFPKEKPEESAEAQLRAGRGDIPIDVPPPVSTGEKIVDVAAGLSGFLAHMVLLRKLTPSEVPPILRGPVAFEMENAIAGGRPGEGLLLGGALQGIGGLPLKGLKGEAAKLGLESTVFAGLAATQEGADEVDILVAAMIPPAMKGATLARKTYRDRLRQVKTADEYAEVIREANFFKSKHEEAIQFIENATPETLNAIRKRYADRPDHPVASAMVELIDSKLKGEPLREVPAQEVPPSAAGAPAPAEAAITPSKEIPREVRQPQVQPKEEVVEPQAPPVEEVVKPEAAAPVGVLKPEAREPWEMTQSRYAEKIGDVSVRGPFAKSSAEIDAKKRGGDYYAKKVKDEERNTAGGIREKEKWSVFRRVSLEEHAKEHREWVEVALKAGKPVPPEVLKDYPDLQPKETSSAQETPSLREESQGEVPREGEPVGGVSGVDESEVKQEAVEPSGLDPIQSWAWRVTHGRAANPTAYVEGLTDAAVRRQAKSAGLKVDGRDAADLRAVLLRSVRGDPVNLEIENADYRQLGEKLARRGLSKKGGTTQRRERLREAIAAPATQQGVVSQSSDTEEPPVAPEPDVSQPAAPTVEVPSVPSSVSEGEVRPLRIGDRIKWKGREHVITASIGRTIFELDGGPNPLRVGIKRLNREASLAEAEPTPTSTTESVETQTAPAPTRAERDEGTASVRPSPQRTTEAEGVKKAREISEDVFVQPWEMSADAFVQSNAGAGLAESALRKAHRDWVEEALAKKYSVPKDVLADYPDLAKKPVQPKQPSSPIKKEAQQITARREAFEGGKRSDLDPISLVRSGEVINDIGQLTESDKRALDAMVESGKAVRTTDWNYQKGAPGYALKGATLPDKVVLEGEPKPTREEVRGKRGGRSSGAGGGEAMAASGSLYDPAVITPNPARIPPSSIQGGRARPLREIIFDIGAQVKRGVRTARPSRGALGTYYPSSARTVIRFAGDLDVTAHELSHAIDDLFGLVRQWNTPRGVSKSGAKLPQTSPFDTELFKDEFQQTVKRSYRKAQKRREGVAEFIRAWIVNPDVAKAAAPKFHDHFVKQVSPEFMGSLQSFSDDVRQWIGSSAVERTLSNVEMQTATPSIVHRIKDWLRRKDDTFDTTWIDRLGAATLDSLGPVWKGVQFAKDMRGLHDLLPSNDPQVLIRTFAGFDKKFFEVMKGGPVRADNKPIPGMGGVEWLLEPLDSTSKTTLESEMNWTVALMVNERITERALLLAQEAADLVRTSKELAEVKAEADKEPGLMIGGQSVVEVIRELQREVSRLRKSLGFDGPLSALPRWLQGRTERLAGVGGGIFSDAKQAAQALNEFAAFDPERLNRLKEAASRYRQWANAVLQYARDKGRISKEQYDGIVERNQQYVAMMRIFEESDPEMFRSSGGKRLASVRNVINRFTGSTRPIQNPYVSLLQQTHSVMRESDRNEAMLSVRNILTAPRGMHEGLVLNLDSIGSKASQGDENTVSIFVNGEREHWQFHKDIHAALNDWYNRSADNLVYRAIQFIPRMTRGFITHSPDFLTRNFIRDQFYRSILSENATKPWSAGTYLSRRRISGTAQDLRDFHLYGGGMFGYYDQSQRGYNKQIARHVRKLSSDQSTVLAVPGMVARGYHNLAKASEISGRLVEFDKAYRNGIEEGLSEYDAGLMAAYKARGLLDFSVAGTVVREINKIIIFTNAAVQGMARTVRGAKNNPVRFASRWGAYIMLPSLMFYALIRALDQEDEWEQLPAWQKDFFWNVKIGPDLWLRIPKPWELGVVASGVERLANQIIGGNDHAFYGYDRSLQQAMVPVDEGTFVGPFRAFAEDVANYDFFTDRNIVSPWEDGLDLELRDGTERASRIGQIVGNAVGKDSRDIDHYLTSLFGGTGRLAASASDLEWEDTLRSFIGITARTPTYSAVDVQAVLEFSERRGLSQSRANQRLMDMLRRAVQADDKVEKDRLAKEAVEYASELRERLEASQSIQEAEAVMRGGSSHSRSR